MLTDVTTGSVLKTYHYHLHVLLTTHSIHEGTQNREHLEKVTYQNQGHSWVKNPSLQIPQTKFPPSSTLISEPYFTFSTLLSKCSLGHSLNSFALGLFVWLNFRWRDAIGFLRQKKINRSKVGSEKEEAPSLDWQQWCLTPTSQPSIPHPRLLPQLTNST